MVESRTPISIQTWVELQDQFLKKKFHVQKTLSLKREINTFTSRENENFYTAYKRFMEAINSCAHHGYATWMLVD